MLMVSGDIYIQIPQGQTQQQNGVYTFTLSKDTMQMNTGPLVIKKGHTVTYHATMNADNFVVPEHAPENKPVNG